MAVRIVCAALAVCGLGLHGVARADFSKALKDYNAGQYESAHAQFLDSTLSPQTLSILNLTKDDKQRWTAVLCSPEFQLK